MNSWMSGVHGCAESWAAPSLPPSLFHLQGVLIVLRLWRAPGHIQAALKVLQDQAADDSFMRLLQQLLKQPQSGNADLE